MRPTTTPLSLTSITSHVREHISEISFHGDDVMVTGITHDSRAVVPGDIYVAVPGFTRHGIEFAEQAIAAGAVAIATDAAGCVTARELGVTAIELVDVRRDMAHLAAEVYGHPERDLHIVGVTGTNGKTTITHVMRAIGQSHGKSIGVIGTVGVFINDEVLPQSRTTPESTDLYALLSIMKQRGVEFVFMEVSSHAVVLHRVEGLVFDVALFTNLTQDHLDFHSTMAEYFAAKAQIFGPGRARHAVICVDDEWGTKLATNSAIPQVTVGAGGQWQVEVRHDSSFAGCSFTGRSTSGDSVSAAINMLGSFNAVNGLMAALAWDQLGIALTDALESLRNLPQIPGRLELVDCGQEFLAVVDYAHTPDAVRKVLTELRAACTGTLTVVLGCGGDRDAAKRPVMGKAAAEIADVVIVTDDNPRSEEPAAIRAEVLTGARTQSAVVQEIGDRAEAIAVALESATTGDVVAVLGKGHESGQEIAGVIHPFNDRDVVCEVLNRA